MGANTMSKKMLKNPMGKFIRTVLDDGVEHRYYINSARAANDEK
jgi:hypothetical protein